MPFAIERSNRIQSRYQFCDLCNLMNFREAAEIGVDRGEFASRFLAGWRGNTLLLIDPYEPYENMPWGREADRLMAIVRLAHYGDRVKFIPLKSPEAANQIHGDWHLQFVYIDGCHLYETVKADIAAWYDRIDPGGIVAGHDFLNDNGVQRAVTDFARERGLTIFTVPDVGTPPSWYIHKP